MENDSLNIETMTINELTEYIINKLNVNLQLEIVGDEYDYYLFTALDETKRKEIILSSIKQMPEDIMENIIIKGNTR